MTVKQIQVVYERKFNLGDYNSLHLGVTMWADLDEADNENHLIMIKQLQDDARDSVRNEYGRIPKRVQNPG